MNYVQALLAHIFPAGDDTPDADKMAAAFRRLKREHEQGFPGLSEPVRTNINTLCADLVHAVEELGPNPGPQPEPQSGTDTGGQGTENVGA